MVWGLHYSQSAVSQVKFTRRIVRVELQNGEIRWRAQKQFSRVFLGNLIGYGPIHAHNALRIISSLLFIKQIMFTNVVSVNRTATIIEQSRNQHSDGASP